MKMAVYHGSGRFSVEEAAIPMIEDDEAILRVEAVGICGTDVHKVVHDTVQPPVVLGHEVAGTVHSVGEDVTKLKVGDKVAAAHHAPCMSCSRCFSGHHSLCDQYLKNNFVPGGFSQYVKLGPGHVAHTVFPAGDLSVEEAAFMEPLGCCVRGVEKLALNPWDTVLVQGAGPIGIMLAQLASLVPVAELYVSDFNLDRLELAARLSGATPVDLNRGSATSFFRDNPVELTAVVVSVGNEVVYEESLKLCGRGGRLLAFAEAPPDATLKAAVNHVYGKELGILGSYSSSPRHLFTALQLLRKRKVKVAPMVTHRVSLDELGEGIRMAKEAKECVKVMVKPFQDAGE
ncbi:MAG: zinc-dependent dehydrogenase [Promethearchaeota archaeon]